MITIVLGTRPEAIKALPIIRELKRRKKAFRVIHTGQHTDLMIGTGLKPNLFLQVPSENDPEAYVGACGEALSRYVAPSLPSNKGETVLVIGDTASAMAGAIWGNMLGYPVAHVEAGLRSHDLSDPWPEEGFRVEIDRLATYHFCPTEGNLANLCREPAEWVEKSIVTGNTIVDALRFMKGERTTPKNYVLVTLHRRESFGEPLENVLWGLRSFARGHSDTAILWPMHPNPRVGDALRKVPMPVNVLMRGPVPYKGFLELLASANCVLTDSGGVVEEATTLGVPIVCARNKTERPEAFELPWNVLAGTNELSVEGNLRLKYHESGRPSEVFGDGNAAKRIVEVLT